jgi:cytochrome c5
MREKWSHIVAIFTGFLVVILVAAFAYVQNSAPTPNADTATDRATDRAGGVQPATGALDPQCIAAGREIYQQQECATCHAIAGQGNPRNPLDDVGARRSAQELRDWTIGADAVQEILSPRAFDRKQAYRHLPDEDLRVLVIFLQSLRPGIGGKAVLETTNPPVPVTADGNGCAAAP